MTRKERLPKGEEQFPISGKAVVKLSKFPGKKGLISTYPDSWSVVIEIHQTSGVKILTLRPFNEDFATTKSYYEALKKFLEDKHG